MAVPKRKHFGSKTNSYVFQSRFQMQVSQIRFDCYVCRSTRSGRAGIKGQKGQKGSIGRTGPAGNPAPTSSEGGINTARK